MSDYTHKNLKDDVADSAERFGLSPDMEAHFAARDLELENAGVSYQRLAPNFRHPFGHHHATQEELYVIVGGSGRLKLNDDVIVMHPKLPHSSGLNREGRIRYAVYFRYLER